MQHGRQHCNTAFTRQRNNFALDAQQRRSETLNTCSSHKKFATRATGFRRRISPMANKNMCEWWLRRNVWHAILVPRVWAGRSDTHNVEGLWRFQIARLTMLVGISPRSPRTPEGTSEVPPVGRRVPYNLHRRSSENHGVPFVDRASDGEWVRKG